MDKMMNRNAGFLIVTILMMCACNDDGTAPEPGESPLQCVAGAPEIMLIDTVGVGGGEGGDFETHVDVATWGHVAGRVRTESEENQLGPGVTMGIGWIDYIAAVPTDSTDLERPVVIRAEVSGTITVSGSDPENSSVHTHFSTGDGCPGCAIPDGEVEDSRRFSQDGPGTFNTSGVALYRGRLGDWIRMEALLYLNVGQDFDGSSSESEASLKIERMIDVVDLYTGDPVAISEICTASGHEYPE